MAHYTITIASLMKNNFDFKMNDYPIFDESYRNILNQKILNHYYNDEIGLETAALFRFYLNNRLNEIMPYYNILYSEQNKRLDKLSDNIDLTETNNTKIDNTDNSTTESKSTNSGNSTSETSSNNKNLYQDTPQGNLSQIDFNNQNYATNLTLDNNNSNISSNDTNTTDINSLSNVVRNETSETTRTLKGNSGGMQNITLLNEIKNNIMNIDLMIIDELQDLFMGVY